MTTQPPRSDCSEYVVDGWSRRRCQLSPTVLRDGKPFCGTHDPVKVAAREEEKLRRSRALTETVNRKAALLAAQNKVVEAAKSAAGTWCFNYPGINTSCGSCRGCNLNAALAELKTAEENRFK